MPRAKNNSDKQKALQQHGTLNPCGSPKRPIKGNVKKNISPSAQRRHFFVGGIQPNPLNVHLRSSSGVLARGGPSSPLWFHSSARDGAHSFPETDKRNDCSVANHGPI
jgi:hypothetical protein